MREIGIAQIAVGKVSHRKICRMQICLLELRAAEVCLLTFLMRSIEPSLVLF